MSQATADIVGTTGAKFTITVSSGTVTSAFLKVRGTPDVPLSIDTSGHEISIPNLSTADSKVRLDIVWAPGDQDAVIDVGFVTTGTVTPANPKGTLDAGKTPGFAKLFGKSVQT